MLHYTVNTPPDDRVGTLRQLALLDTPPEEAFDRFTRLAVRVLQVPVSLISLIDEERQFFKSCIGIPEPYATLRATPLSHSFCQHVVQTRQPLLVADARTHPLLHDNLAISDMDVVAYLGVPLIIAEGHALGAFCAIDTQPRAWTTDDLATLTDLAAMIMTEIELRRDVVERQRVEAALQANEHFLRNVYNGVAESIFVSDVEPDGTIRCVGVNTAHERNSGRTSAAFVGLTADDVFPADVAALVKQRHHECIASGAPITYEEVLPFHDEQTWWLTTLHPLSDEHGQVRRIIGTSLNITERKRAEQAQSRLQRRLLEMQKYESMGVLAGGVAHDFNNMLTAIMGNIELAKLDLPPTSSATVFLKQIEATTQRAAELTHQMLAYAGRASLVPQRLNLNALVAEMIHLLHVSIPKQTTLQCDFTIVASIEADATQLRQVIMNLVLNAAEAIGAVRGQILVTTAQVEADARYLADAYLAYDISPGTYVALTVADSGCGMDAATQRRMFDPFFTTKPNGHGLGLAAVLGIVRRHGGTLRIESKPGQGTAFTVLLPTEPMPHPVADEPNTFEEGTRAQAAAQRLNGSATLTYVPSYGRRIGA